MIADALSRRSPCFYVFALACALVGLGLPCVCGQDGTGLEPPGLEQALLADNDVWGLAAMGQPNGPTFSFFKSLLPPLRYVNAEFRHYPIVLSAPGAKGKCRLVSNGSAVNARAQLGTWKDQGVPFQFSVGEPGNVFGADLSRLTGPVLEGGWIPAVTLAYSNAGAVYHELVFAPVSNLGASNGLCYVAFETKSAPGRVYAKAEAAGPLSFSNHFLLNTNGLAVAACSSAWTFDSRTHSLSAPVSRGKRALLLVATTPVPPAALGDPASSFDPAHAALKSCWERLLAAGCNLQIPEDVASHAWKASIVALFTMAEGNRMNYSHGNAYERLYQAECGDAVMALDGLGFESSAQAMLDPLVAYSRDALQFHNSGFKLQNLARHYWLTRDRAFLEKHQATCFAEIQKILNGREPASGLLPREQYCGDIFTSVYSLNSDSACWRGLRDIASALKDARLCSEEQIRDWMRNAAEFRASILRAVDQSEVVTTDPPFIPVALFGEEKAYDRLTASKLGSYWVLMAPYILGSGIFGPGSARETALVDYLQEHGGVAMGMIRFHQHSGLFANENALDDLYSLRYTEKLLERDQSERALVSFYGKLAQGFTENTFVGAEGTGLRAVDSFGRPMYLPPNASGTAFYLATLRGLLVQDWDLSDDGVPETLRLAFATPRAWLLPGKEIAVQNVPTAFGPVSFRIKSELSRHRVIAEIAPPQRNHAAQLLLRLRLPGDHHIIRAWANGTEIFAKESCTLDLTPCQLERNIRLRVETN